jgi:hypothetical protein
MTPLNSLILFGSIVMLLVTIELVRRQHLREKYSILWLGIFILFIGISLTGKSVDKIATTLKVGYPPSLVFVAAIFLLILLLLMVSVITSHQTNRIIKLTQRLALLEEKLTRLSGNKKNSDKNNNSTNSLD